MDPDESWKAKVQAGSMDLLPFGPLRETGNASRPKRHELLKRPGLESAQTVPQGRGATVHLRPENFLNER